MTELSDAERAFLIGLEKLSRETGIAIKGCGCCGSPSLFDLEPYELHAEAGYGCYPYGGDAGGNVTWYCLDPERPHRWEDDQKLIVKEVRDASSQDSR